MNKYNDDGGLAKRYGDWALVTGASSGIGEQFARLLAAAGINLIICGRREVLLQSLAEELRQSGVTVLVQVCDLGNDEQLQKLIAEANKVPLGIVISNAGFGAKGDFLAHDAARMDHMIRTNCLATMALAHALLPNMVSRRRGAYLFTGSIEGYLPFPLSAPYAASKAFVHSLGASLWQEMREHHIDVLVLSPGSTDTDAPVSQGVPRENLMGLMQPKQVAEQALRHLGKTVYFTPGLHNRVFIKFLELLPAKLALRLAAAGMHAALQPASAKH